MEEPRVHFVLKEPMAMRRFLALYLWPAPVTDVHCLRCGSCVHTAPDGYVTVHVRGSEICFVCWQFIQRLTGLDVALEILERGKGNMATLDYEIIFQ